ncbi:hypothetical protein [Streptomyces sp. KS_5]|uniref:hypothetical protein n=1 Tax=Streptomyces TaxID=1883 RepID=UPI0015A0C949|nr:hypothetical protein [Streptomyces sp. KS_5]
MRLNQQLLALEPDYRIEELAPRLSGLSIYVADWFDNEIDGIWADRRPLRRSRRIRT